MSSEADRRHGGTPARRATELEGLEALYRKNAALMRRRLVARFVRSRREASLARADVEDAIQDGFARVLEIERRGRPMHHEKRQAYLMMSAINRCFDHFRRRRRQECLLRDLLPTQWRDSALELGLESMAVEETRARLELTVKYLDEVPEPLSNVFRLRFVQDLSQRKTADYLGLTRRRVRTFEVLLLKGLRKRIIAGD